MSFSTRATWATWIGAVAITLMVPVVHAGNEVVNPGFEDGLLGWTPSPLLGVAAVTSEFRSGSRSAEFSYDAAGGSASLTRNVEFLEPALVYDFSFYLKLQIPCAATVAGTCYSNDPGADFDAALGGGNPVALSREDTGDWVRYFATLTNLGTVGGNTPVSLAFTYTPSTAFDLYLDDISLSCDRTSCEPQGNNSIPEPGTLLLFGIALAAGSMIQRRKTVH